MTTDLGITYCSRDTAHAMAKEAIEHDGQHFADKYGVVWPLKYSSSVVAAFVEARLKELGASGRDFDSAKKEITVDYIRQMFEYNNLPLDLLWIGDTTMEMTINTFLRAFIDDGYITGEYDEEIEECGEYTKIRGEMCKKHGPYKKWMIYRAWNVREDHGKMKYFAVKDGEVLSAGNLGGIKDQVTKYIA